MRRYHYSLDDQTRVGPVTLETLRAKAVAGELKPTHFVFVEGEAQWVEASQVPGLFPPPAPRATKTGARDSSEPEAPHIPRPRPPALRPLLVGDYAATPPRARAMPIASGLYGPPEPCPLRYRAAATAADLAIVSALLAAVIPAARGVARSLAGGGGGDALLLATVLAVVITPWLYHAGLDCSPWRGTLGKLALTIRVVDARGKRISFRRATVRHFAKFVSMPPLGAGFFWAWLDPRLRTWHDRLSGTAVERTPPV